MISILEGDICDRKDDVEIVKSQLDEQLVRCRVKGLASVVVAQSVAEGMKNMCVLTHLIRPNICFCPGWSVVSPFSKYALLVGEAGKFPKG